MSQHCIEMIFYYICLFFVLLYHVNCSTDLSILKTGFKASPSSVGLQLFVDVKNEADDDFQVELTPEQCCLKSDDEVDCDVVEMLGSCYVNIPKGTTKGLHLVAPLLDSYNRKGYCTLYLDYQANKNINIKREIIKIYFDTSGISMQADNIKKCVNIDENPLDDCKPVNCETYYNGKKSYYSKNLKRCVEVPPCVADEGGDGERIYDTKTNTCIDGGSVRSQDIDYIKTLEKNRRQVEDVTKIKNLNNYENLTNADTYADSELTSEENNQMNIKCLLHKYFPASNSTLMIVCSVVVAQCTIIICLLCYFLTRCKTCCKGTKNIKNIYNQQQDVVDTTPLMTSNVDTGTTNYQCLSESSIDFDKKIKYYKARQKDRKDAKISMSDDILTKCINRRTWTKINNSSNELPEYLKEFKNNDEDAEDEEEVVKDKFIMLSSPKTRIININESDTKTKAEIHIDPQILSSNKVNIVNEIQHNTSNHRKSTKEAQTSNTLNEKKNKDLKLKFDDYDFFDDQCTSSETELECHSYNDIDSNGKQSDILTKHSSKRISFIKGSKSKHSNDSSPGKSVQACFSNDSIDDLLSETGLMYTAGENISKYSFTTSSSRCKSMWSGLSGKTSKNLLKNVFSMILHKRSRSGPLSDPGPAESDTHLELLHVGDLCKSKKTSYSSSSDLDIHTMLKDDMTH